MNICKYCKSKGMTLDQYNEFKDSIKTTAIDIRTKQKYNGGMYYNTKDLFTGITLQDEEIKYYIIDELKKLDVEFRDNLELYRIASNEYDKTIESEEMTTNKELKEVYNNDDIKILINKEVTRINVIDSITNELIYKHDYVYINKDYFYNHLNDIALYFVYNKDNIKAHYKNLEDLFFNNKIIRFNIIITNLKKEIQEQQRINQYNQQEQQLQDLKDKVIKLANKLNIIVIESIHKGILLFKPNIKYLRLQNSKEFINLIDNMNLEEFNKCATKEVLKIYNYDNNLNTYKEIYNYLIKLSSN